MSSSVRALARLMSSEVCAFTEKGTSWTVDARLVAVTMIAPSSGAGAAGEVGCCGFAACAACSCAVCAAAGAAMASTAVPISNEDMRMETPHLVVCCVADTMPEARLWVEEEARCLTHFRAAPVAGLLQEQR